MDRTSSWWIKSVYVELQNRMNLNKVLQLWVKSKPVMGARLTLWFDLYGSTHRRIRHSHINNRRGKHTNRQDYINLLQLKTQRAQNTLNEKQTFLNHIQLIFMALIKVKKKKKFFFNLVPRFLSCRWFKLLQKTFHTAQTVSVYNMAVIFGLFKSHLQLMSMIRQRSVHRTVYSIYI